MPAMTSPPPPPPPPYTELSYEHQTDTINSRPPPLPPRSPPAESRHPPIDASIMAMSSHDPRSSSTQSLVPDPDVDNTGMRRLLLVYIHGFMGDETSFRSFPAHVHNLVTVTLADSHVVHTKLYPRYRSRNALQVARDDFSRWLAPHEDQWTDVILLGHSMGGLLAADVTIAFRHRIIGVINFDVPFLGMHPGIVKAGLGSIFSPPPAPQDKPVPQDMPGKKPSRIGTLFNPKPNDPNYNPSFDNDVRLPVRKGWENTLHWVGKHYANGLREATKGLVKSHLEFGGAMADYKELKDRYARVRALEEDDQRKRASANPQYTSPPRIRFVNYYTVSTGRPKKPKRPKSSSPSRRNSSVSLSHKSDDTKSPSSEPQHTGAGHSPQISINIQEQYGSETDPPSGTTSKATSVIDGSTTGKDAPPNLPDIPPIPKEPAFIDLMVISDKAQRKAAEKEYEVALKEYQRAVKARNKAINERTKLEEKWEKQQQKLHHDKSTDSGKHPNKSSPPDMEAMSEDVEALTLGDIHTQDSLHNGNHPYGNYDFSRSAIMSQPPPDDHSSFTDSSLALSTTDSQQSHTVAPTTENGEEKPKVKKLKKFCMLPPKDAQGNKDPTWVKVHMEGMDEVTAHTSLFFLSDTYERLVGDVGARIEEWVREADSMRLVQEMQSMQ